MKEATRPYRQRSRAAAAEAKTERILRAALDLFQERPFDQLTLVAVAERAGVGVQTVIRRAGSKDGLARAVSSWVAGQVAESRGAPLSADPATVAAALERQYEQWGAVTERTLHQEDVSPALADSAAGGRRAHREWLETAFADALATAEDRDSVLARLIAVCGVEVWLLLRRDGGLSAAQTRDAVTRLISATIER